MFSTAFSLVIIGYRKQNRRPEKKKVIHRVIFLGRVLFILAFVAFFHSLFAHRLSLCVCYFDPLTLRTKGTCIDCPLFLLYRHLIGKSALKRGIKIGPRKKKSRICCVAPSSKARSSSKKYCILFIDPKASRSRTCHDSLFRGPIINCP